MGELSLKGTSNWLTAMPHRNQGQYLNKSEIHDLVRMRPGMNAENQPQKCVCGKTYSVNHSQDCHRGGYINTRHDKVRDFIYKKAAQVFNEAEIEPRFLPINDEILHPGSNIANEARPYIRIRSFYRDYSNTFVEVKVLNLRAETHIRNNLQRKPSSKLKRKRDVNIRTEFTKSRTDPLLLWFSHQMAQELSKPRNSLQDWLLALP